MKTILQRINATLFWSIPILACIAIYKSMENKFWAVFTIASIAYAFFCFVSWALNKRGTGK